jgi:hypothetical protein
MRRSLALAWLFALAGCNPNPADAYLEQSQLVLADVSGTWYGSGAPTPRTHLLLQQTRLPALMPGTPQFIDPDWTPQSGCVVSRFDSTASPYPNVDIATGPASYTGYATQLLAADSKTPRPPGADAPPIPGTINCARATQDPYYKCTYGQTGDPQIIAGDDPLSVVFPPLAKSFYTTTCPTCACDQQQIPDGAGGMTTVCEQHPLADGSHVVEDLESGGGYSTLTQINLPVINGMDNHKFVRFTVNGTDVPTLGDVVLDGMGDISIGWNCDPSPSNMVASGDSCPAASPTNDGMVALYAISSTNSRDAFAPGSAFSVLQCYDAIDDPRGTIIISRQAIQVLLGSATSGSVLFAAVRLNVTPTTSLDHTVYLAEGRGQFALIQHGPIGPDMSVPIDMSLTD